MAIQKGDIKFTGKIGNLVGRKVNGKLILSTPGGFTKERLEAGKDTIYKNVTNLNAEWKLSSPMASAIYQTLKSVLNESHFSSRICSKLTGHFQKTRVFDNAPPGQRRPTIQSLHTLRNYCFNNEAAGIWNFRPTVNSDGKEGTIHFQNPITDIKWPFEADLMRLIAINMHIDLEQITVSEAQANYIDIPREDAAGPLDWSFRVYTETGLTAIAVKFFQTVNQTNYELFNHQYNALHIL